MLHAVVQGVVEVIDVEEPTATFPLVWMGASAVDPIRRLCLAATKQACFQS